MFISLICFALIVSFNHCCGASHLIPTTVLSPNVKLSPNSQHMYPSVGSAYSLYASPFGEYQYSASYSHPSVELPITQNKNQMNSNADQMDNYFKRDLRPSAPVEYPYQGPVRQHSSRLSERNAKHYYSFTNSLPIALRIPKTLINSTTLSPTLQKSRFERIITHLNRSTIIRTTRRPNIILETLPTTVWTPNINKFETIQTMHSINNWPKINIKHKQQTQSQSRIQSQPLSQPLSQPIPQPIAQPLPQPQSQPQSQPQFQPQQQTQQNIPQSYEQKMAEFYHQIQVQSAIDRQNGQNLSLKSEPIEQSNQESMPTTFSPTEEQTTPMKVNSLDVQKEVKDDKKEKMTSEDSEQNYRMQFFNDLPKESNYEPIPQSESQTETYGTPNENGYPVPESYSYAANPEPESEPESVDYYGDNDKEMTEEYKRDYDLKILLERFLQQLEVLKLVAARGLTKANGDSYSYGSKLNNQLIGQTLNEPSVSKTSNTYDEYQNERSFEQNLANSESPVYKDTLEKSGKKHPCKKSYQGADSMGSPVWTTNN